jgi:hypothetical protein
MEAGTRAVSMREHESIIKIESPVVKSMDEQENCRVALPEGL